MLYTHHSFHPAPTFWPVRFKLSYPLRSLQVTEVVLRTALLLVCLQQTSTKIMRAHACTHAHTTTYVCAPTTTATTATNTTQCVADDVYHKCKKYLIVLVGGRKVGTGVRT